MLVLAALALTAALTATVVTAAKDPAGASAPGAGMVPARKSIRETPEVQNLPQGPIAKQIENLRFLPPVPGLGDVQAQTLEIAVANAVLGKQSPADALKEQAAKATKLMEANKAKFGS